MRARKGETKKGNKKGKKVAKEEEHLIPIIVDEDSTETVSVISKKKKHVCPECGDTGYTEREGGLIMIACSTCDKGKKPPGIE